LDSIAIKSKELGLSLTTEQQQSVLEDVKRFGTQKRGLVTDTEFLAIVNRLKQPA
jgi:isopropylmalate/homocitrate/citramalate synthase